MGRDRESEIEKIKDKLRPGETVELVSTQKILIKPATFFITNTRCLMRVPRIVGDIIQSCEWTDVGDFTIKKGMMSSTISFTRSQGDAFTMSEISKKDVDKMHALIERYVSMAKEEANKPVQPTTTQSAPAQNPLDALKMKLINGEITEEEYNKTKKILE